MGGSASTTKFGVEEDKELRDFLSNEDIQLVQETWLTIQGDFDAIGLTIFKRFFVRNKPMKILFHSRLMSDEANSFDIGGGMQFDEQKVLAHGRIVMESLDAAIECLYDSEKLSTLLGGIGERHVLYGVHIDMIPLLWPSISSTFKEKLGRAFTTKVNKAWEHVFQYIGSKVIEGMARWHPKRNQNGRDV